nr:exocyst complex component EXO70A1-like [Ipomoea trifida]GMC51270.1 exocyst complex component EXO70A1-like [Ipomoea batatas]
MVVAGGGIHSLTIESMNYLTLIADYSNVLGDILANSPPPETSSLPESYFGVSDTATLKFLQLWRSLFASPG